MLCGTIVPNEPKSIRKLFPDLVECPGGYDISLFTKLGRVGIERKKVPGDLLSSIEDGRLGKEILAMREECKIMIVLFHGKIKFSSDGQLKSGNRISRWTDKGIRNLRRTLQFVEGCYIEDAHNDNEMVKILSELQEYFDKSEHYSIHFRQGIKSSWIRPSREEKIIHFYQGLPGAGITIARKLYDKFPTPLSLFRASTNDIDDIPRIGKIMAEGIYNFLRGVSLDKKGE